MAMAVTPGEHLEEGDGVLDPVKGRIQVYFLAEGDPCVPVGCGFAGACRNHSLGDILCRKAEVTEETIAGFRV